jgi:outer membrane protein TolC
VAFDQPQAKGADDPSNEPLGDGDEASLETLVAMAVDQNPRLVRLYRIYRAAAARSRYVDKLPDPKFSVNVFGNPIETASGSQRANLGLSQVIPWLSKLDAEQQRACFEALAARADFLSERLRVIASLKTNWIRLFVLDHQIDVAKANQELLKSLLDVANAKVATAATSQGDVLLGILELSKIEERLLAYRRRRTSFVAEMNRLIARPAETPIHRTSQISVGVPTISAMEGFQLALRSQPEIHAAQLRTKATCWGIEVARLSRRPVVALSANYASTDDNRPASSVVRVGEDPWSIGLQFSMPLWREKYDALRDEATWKHLAAHGSVEDLEDSYQAHILDLITEARRAAATASLYQDTIMPQARQTLEADQQSYSTGAVEFDRVVQGYRNLLTLELGYLQAVGDLGIAVVQLERAAGAEIPVSKSTATP